MVPFRPPSKFVVWFGPTPPSPGSRTRGRSGTSPLLSVNTMEPEDRTNISLIHSDILRLSTFTIFILVRSLLITMSPLTRGQEGDLDRTRSLVEWAHSLAYKDLPVEVVDRTKMFFVDWIGCAIAGRDHVSVRSMVQYSKVMGPETGACEIVGYPEQLTSAAFASLVNAASSHVVEQDDLHNSSMMHPVRPCSSFMGM